jgi:hypothetical protein
MQEYISAFQRIAELADRAGKMEPDDLVRAHTAQFICVLVSGIVEKACARLLTDHAARAASPRIARYAGSRLKQLQNLNAPKIEELLQSFDPLWAQELEAFWSDQIRDAISSVVNNRNQIAHGQHVGVSLVQVIQWAKDARAFCDKLREMTTR